MTSIAKSVITECLRAKPGEPVAISTYPHTIDMANELAAECYKAGAEPLMVLETDDFFYAQFDHLSEEQLKKASPHCLGLAEYIPAYVWLGGPKDPTRMRDVPSSKWTAFYEGEEPHWNKLLEKKARSVGMAIGQVTEERARTYGFDYNEWMESVEAGMAVEYAEMEKVGKLVGAILSLPGKVHLTAPNGTDVTFELAQRTAHVNDGVIDEDDIKTGNRDVSLPAGDVSVAPVEGSARGVIVSDIPQPLQGKLLEGLTFHFGDDGTIPEITGKANADLVQDQFKDASGDHNRIGALSVGVNNKLKPGFLTSTLAAGVVAIGIGDNRHLGGTNKSTWGFYTAVANGTLRIGDKTIVEDGKLAL